MKKFIELIQYKSPHNFTDFEIFSENTISYTIHYSTGGSKEILYNIKVALDRMIVAKEDYYISVYKKTLNFLRMKTRIKKVFEK